MKIHTVIVSYGRMDLTRQALASYYNTVTAPYSLVIADNGSDLDTINWLTATDIPLILLGENRYPGYATNRGFEHAPDDATVLHRADNDWRFLPGWCEEVTRCLDANPRLGQLGLRTGEQERDNGHNVGGNCVIRREIYEEGLRYDERTWPEIRAKKGPGFTEDSLMSPKVTKMGWEWGRVERPCIESLADEDPTDDYYITSWTDRGILEQSRKAYGL